MVNELISRVFATRNVAHLHHWHEDSGFRHGVLGEFYDGIIEILDRFVEAYQGNSGLIGLNVDTSYEIIPSLEAINSDLAWIELHADELTDGITCLQNILDELTDLYLTTRYKLTFLK